MTNIFSILGGLGGLSGVVQGARESAQSGVAMDKAAQAEQTARGMLDRMDRLTLVCMALWALLREKTGLTEQDLLKKVEEIDLSDGVLDGKVRSTVAKCAQCGRAISPRHRRCIYCGAENPSHDPFKAAQ
jgi:hypothetical protein